MFKIAIESLNQDYIEPLNFAVDSLPLPLMELADNIFVQTENIDPSEDRVLNDLLRTVLRLREYRLHQELNQLRFLLQDAQSSDEGLNENYQKTIFRNSSTLFNIQKALNQQPTHL